jgi:hypothetical protein
MMAVHWWIFLRKCASLNMQRAVPGNVIVLFSEKKKNNRGVRAYEWPEVELAELVCFLFRQGSHVSDVMMMKEDH